MSSQPEFDVHCGIVAWLGYALPSGSLFHHSPNEGRHHVAWRSKQKRMGMQAGWPDLELLVPIDYWFDPAWGPIYLEIKADKGRLTKHQKSMLELLDNAGGHTATVRSIDDTRDFLQQRIELRA